MWGAQSLHGQRGNHSWLRRGLGKGQEARGRVGRAAQGTLLLGKGREPGWAGHRDVRPGD